VTRALFYLKQAALAVALPIVLVAIWWIASDGSTSFYWPSLHDILKAFPTAWPASSWWHDVLPSVGRLLVSYLLALLIGIAVGVALGLVSWLRALCEPVMEFLRAIPPPVIVPVVALFTGFTGATPKIIAIALGCVWPILLNTVEGVRGLDEVQLDTARSYRLRTHTRLLRIVLPGASPQIAAGARQALSVGVILMVISELFGASSGLGARFVNFQRSFAIPSMWTGIILLGLIGVVLSIVFRIAEHHALAWYRGLRQADRGA
jgi:ABC-type nitrate/sulfonate/bicarbonate transport system permease component